VAQDRPLGPLEDLVGALIGSLGTSLADSLTDLDDRRGRTDDRPRDVPRPGPGAHPFTPRTAARTPKLDRYGHDLTAAAARGELDPVIGRDGEVEQVLEVLARRTKNNPVLVGDPGVGKTAVAEGIAQRVVDGAVPESLRGVRVVALDLAGMVAGTRYRGDFEQRLTGVLDEVVAANRSVVLFVDELHTMVGAGSAEGAPMDAAAIVKPALARGDLRMIGATTAQEYRRHIERDPALERRFEPVRVAEPSVAATVAILRGLRSRYESHHGVRFDDSALTAAAELSDRHLTDRFLPDKAIDLVDRAGARARIRAGTGHPSGEGLRRARQVALDAGDQERVSGIDREMDAPEITADDVAAVLAESTGIPVARLTTADRTRLLGLEDLLRERVVGQDEAVTAVADAVRAGRAGLAHPERPVGSFLFLGPTGVGKTELARALADALFGTEPLRFDMSEFADRTSALRLVGAPPGHVGYDDAGQLTEAVRRTPYAVLLLDEIEKAHPEVTATLLQVLDAGRLTDSHGRTVDFTRTVVIMTSNLGAEALLAAGRPTDDVRESVASTVRARFRPEFWARIDEVALFAPLGPAEVRAITALLLADTAGRLAGQGVGLTVTDAAVAHLAALGHRPEFGARPLRRVLARELVRPLARMLLGGELGAGQQATVDLDGTVLTFRIT
jgi:ATP-dependent Clp protease ATP-binding subunit ClpC